MIKQKNISIQRKRKLSLIHRDLKDWVYSRSKKLGKRFSDNIIFYCLEDQINQFQKLADKIDDNYIYQLLHKQVDRLFNSYRSYYDLQTRKIRNIRYYLPHIDKNIKILGNKLSDELCEKLKLFEKVQVNFEHKELVPKNIENKVSSSIKRDHEKVTADKICPQWFETIYEWDRNLEQPRLVQKISMVQKLRELDSKELKKQIPLDRGVKKEGIGKEEKKYLRYYEFVAKIFGLSLEPFDKQTFFEISRPIRGKEFKNIILIFKTGSEKDKLKTPYEKFKENKNRAKNLIKSNRKKMKDICNIVDNMANLLDINIDDNFKNNNLVEWFKKWISFQYKWRKYKLIKWLPKCKKSDILERREKYQRNIKILFDLWREVNQIEIEIIKKEYEFKWIILLNSFCARILSISPNVLQTT